MLRTVPSAEMLAKTARMKADHERRMRLEERVKSYRAYLMNNKGGESSRWRYLVWLAAFFLVLVLISCACIVVAMVSHEASVSSVAVVSEKQVDFCFSIVDPSAASSAFDLARTVGARNCTISVDKITIEKLEKMLAGKPHVQADFMSFLGNVMAEGEIVSIQYVNGAMVVRAKQVVKVVETVNNTIYISNTSHSERTVVTIIKEYPFEYRKRGMEWWLETFRHGFSAGVGFFVGAAIFVA